MKSKSNTICVVLKGFDSQVVDRTVQEIIDLVKKEKVKYWGPIPLPTKKVIWTVNRGPHIDKEAREQFEQRTHKRMIYLSCSESASNLINAMGTLQTSAGVKIKMRLENRS